MAGNVKMPWYTIIFVCELVNIHVELRIHFPHCFLDEEGLADKAYEILLCLLASNYWIGTHIDPPGLPPFNLDQFMGHMTLNVT